MNSYYLTLVLKPEMDEKMRKTLLDSVVKKLLGDPSTGSTGSPQAGSGQVGKVGKTTSAASSAEVATKAEKASVVKEDLWGVRDLAYPIKKQSKGFYAHYEISADPKNAKGLDKQLKVEEDVLRYLLIRV